REWTIEGIENIKRLFKNALKEWVKLRAEQKATRGKKTKKLTRLRRKVARLRIEIAEEIGRLNMTERSRQRLINAIRNVQKEVRSAERELSTYTERLTKKRLKAEDQKTYKKHVLNAKKRLHAVEDDFHIPPVEVKRSLQSIVTGEQQTGQAKRELVEANLRHLVDSPGHHARDCRPGPHDSHSGAHDRDHQQAHPHLARPGAGTGPRTYQRRDCQEDGHPGLEGAQGFEDCPGANLARDANWRRGRFAPW